MITSPSVLVFITLGHCVSASFEGGREDSTYQCISDAPFPTVPDMPGLVEILENGLRDESLAEILRHSSASSDIPEELIANVVEMIGDIAAPEDSRTLDFSRDTAEQVIQVHAPAFVC